MKRLLQSFKQFLLVDFISATNVLGLLPSGLINQLRAWILSVHGTIPKTLLVTRGETAIQVGTPNPRTMKELSSAVGQNGRVIIIEPEPQNIQVLKDKMNELKYSNVEIVECAAYSENTQLHLMLAAHPGDHKIEIDGIETDNDYRDENLYDESISVPAYTLDNILFRQNVHAANYIEIMVNGAELEILKGAEHILAVSSDIRLRVKGHARTEDGVSINRPASEFLTQLGYNVNIAKNWQQTVGSNPQWRVRDGDVFATKVSRSVTGSPDA